MVARPGQHLHLTTSTGTSVRGALSLFCKSSRFWARGRGGGPCVLSALAFGHNSLL